MLALVGQPSLHGYYACMVYWNKGAPRRNCRQKQNKTSFSPFWIFLFSRNPTKRFWGLIFWHFWIGRARHPGPPSQPHHVSLEFHNVGGWLTHGDLALDAGVDFLAVAEHRLIPARVRSEWSRLRGKGLSSIWAPASQECSHVGNAGVGVVSLRGAPLALPTFLTAQFKSFFDCGRAVRCLLPLASGRFLHLCVLYGYQGADTDSEQLALTDQLFDAALFELYVAALGQPCLLVGDFNVEPTKIPCLAKGISAGLWVDFGEAWAGAAGLQPAPTCKRSWTAAGGRRRDFILGCPLAAAAILSYQVQSDRWIAPHLAVCALFDYGRWDAWVAQSVRCTPLWPASWLPVVDKTRGSKSAEIRRVWEVYDERLQFMSRRDALLLDESLGLDDVSMAWAVWSRAAEAALADAYQFSGGPLPSGGLVLGRGAALFRWVQLGGPWVRRARANAADALDAADVFLYRDRSIAPLLDMRRRFKVVMDLLDSMIRSGVSLSRSVELTAQWDRILALGPMFPVTLEDLSVDRGLGIGTFLAIAFDVHRRLSDFIHQVVVYRRDAAIRCWRSWIREDPLVHPYRWLRPDLVPPAPFLQCDPCLSPGGSGVLSDPNQIDEEFRKAWLPFFCRSGQRETSLDEFDREVEGWLPLLPEVHLPRLTGQMLADVVLRKAVSSGSLDGWGWRELKALPVSWFDELSRILTKVEDLGVWPDGLLDAYIAMIPKTDGDATPLGQRPLTVLPVVYRIWAAARMNQLDGWFKSWVPDSVFSAGGGRTSVEAWYTSALDIEEVLSGATDSHVHLFGADVVKSFDTVDRGFLDRVLSSLGLPGWFRHAYFEYHAHVRLRFELASGLGQSWTRDGGIPQGCPLSMMFIVALYLPWCRYLSAQVGVRPQLYADNLKCISRDPELILRAARFTTQYVRLVGQEPAPSKCVLLSTSREVRKDMRDWVLSLEGDRWSVKFDVRDLGGHLDTTFRGWSSTLAARIRLVVSRLVLIFVLPLDFHGRVRVVRSMYLPAALHGIEASWLASDSLRKLRSAVCRVVWSRRQPLSSVGAVLSLLDGPAGCDPAFCVVWFRFRLLRRYLALWPAEVYRVNRLLDMVGEGCPGHGPVHLLSASATEIGFTWDPLALAWVRPGLPLLSDLAGPIQHFRTAILDAWRNKVAADLCRRKGFRGGPLLDVHGSLQLLCSSHVRERDTIRPETNSNDFGGFWN